VDNLSRVIDQTTQEAGRVMTVSKTLGNVSTELATSIERFLADVYKDVQERRITLRERMYRHVDITYRGQLYQTEAIDFSECGMRFKQVPELDEGDEIVIDFGKDGKIQGRVVWIDNNEAGVQFNERFNSTLSQVA
jgi:hypothetical protein